MTFGRADANQAEATPLPSLFMDLSIVLPIYNERENVVPLLDEIDAALGSLGKSYEIIAVDDGSTDGTRELLKEEVSRRRHLKVVVFRRNFGQTAAFDAGFRCALGDVIVTMDADLQNDPQDIAAMLTKMEEGWDFVTGWRRDRRDGFVLRTLPSRLANWLIRLVTKTKIHDLGCSLKAYRRTITEELRLYGEMHRFISVLAENIGARVTEVVVHHRARRFGHSKYGLQRTLKVLLDLITIVFMRSYHTKPIYAFGGFGFFMFATSFVLSGIVLYQRIANGVFVHLQPIFLVAIFCALTGFQFIGTGVIAELLARTYFESQDKRTYSIADMLGFDGRVPLASTRPRSSRVV